MGKRETSLLLEKIFNALRTRGISQKDVLEQLGWPLDEFKALTFGRGCMLLVIKCYQHKW